MHEVAESHLRRLQPIKGPQIYGLAFSGILAPIPPIYLLPEDNMAGSKFAYVRNFELPDPLLPGTFMVFRLDGHSFHRSVI
jgi:hypothetical protein